MNFNIPSMLVGLDCVVFLAVIWKLCWGNLHNVKANCIDITSVSLFNLSLCVEVFN